MQIVGLLGIYFDALLVKVKTFFYFHSEIGSGHIVLVKKYVFRSKISLSYDLVRHKFTQIKLKWGVITVQVVHNELLANDDMGRGSEIECHMEYVTLTLMTIRLHTYIHRMLYMDT